MYCHRTWFPYDVVSVIVILHTIPPRWPSVKASTSTERDRRIPLSLSLSLSLSLLLCIFYSSVDPEKGRGPDVKKKTTPYHCLSSTLGNKEFYRILFVVLMKKLCNIRVRGLEIILLFVLVFVCLCVCLLACLFFCSFSEDVPRTLPHKCERSSDFSVVRSCICLCVCLFACVFICSLSEDVPKTLPHKCERSSDFSVLVFFRVCLLVCVLLLLFLLLLLCLFVCFSGDIMRIYWRLVSGVGPVV